MIVKSYLAIPKPNQLTQLADAISALPNCEVTKPDSQENVLVLVMENKNQESEDQTVRKIHNLSGIDHLVLVSSFNEEFQTS